jgi:hypothetical protein
MPDVRRLGEAPTMSNYVPGYPKRNRVFSKRARELEHAVKHGADPETLAKVVERVREAKLNALKAQKQAPPNKRIGDIDSQVARWRTMTGEEIIAKLVHPGSLTANSAD